MPKFLTTHWGTYEVVKGKNSKIALKPWAEEIVEAELSAVLIGANLSSRFGLLFPPVDLRFDQPPAILITSPRDHIRRLETVLINPELTGIERSILEATGNLVTQGNI